MKNCGNIIHMKRFMKYIMNKKDNGKKKELSKYKIKLKGD
jgi:hypothetical protein